MTSLATVSGACTAQLAVPENATIACDTDEECPAEMVCRTNIGLCVAQSADSAAPSLVDPTVTPQTVTLGKTIIASFAADEPLLGTPEVSLQSGELFVPAPQAAGRHVFTYAVSGLEAAGTVPVFASLLDTTGNEATGLLVGSVTFDFTAPQVTEVAADPPVVKPGDQVQLTFRVDETLARAPVVRLVSGQPFTAATSATPGVYAFTRDVDGNEPEGPAALQISVEDVAGNEAAALPVGVFAFDVTDPVLVGDAEVGSEVVRATQVARVVFSVSEALGSDPVVVLTPTLPGTPLPMALSQRVGATYTYSRTIALVDPDDSYQIDLVSFADLAGNPGVGESLGSVTIDNQAPVFEAPAPAVTRERISRVDGFNAFTLTFFLDEVASRHDVTLGTTPIDCTHDPLRDLVRYDCTYTLQAGPVRPGDVSGTLPLAVRAEDVAGNVAFASAPPITFDFDPPDIEPGFETLQLRASQCDLETGLVAVWGFDEGSGPFAGDGLDGDNTLSLVNPARFGDGRHGGALDVDGGTAWARDTTPAANLPVGNAPRTLAAWVLPRTLSDVNFNGVLAYGNRVCQEGQILSLTNSGRVSCANWCNDLIAPASTPAAAVGQWSHIAYTFDGTNRRLWLNGTEVAADVTTLATAVSVTPTRIGSTDIPGRTIDALIDDARIYDRALDQAPLRALMHHGPRGVGADVEVSAATVCTSIRVGFLAKESLTLADLNTTGPGALSFAPVSPPGTFYLFDALVEEPIPDGTYDLELAAVDLAGNAATVTVPLPGVGLVVDTTAPAAPDVITPGRIVYDRAPWGTVQTPIAAALSLTGAAGAAEPGSTVIVYGSADPRAADELGRRTADGTGAFGPIDLSLPDRDRVYVTAVDSAGNESPRTLVRETRWTATIGNKTAGNVFENPHRLVSWPRLPVELTPIDATVATEEDGLSLAADEGQTLLTSAAPGWTRLDMGVQPPSLRRGAIVYDSLRGRAVFFGGSNFNTPASAQNTTYECDGARWVGRSPPTLPPARERHVMAFDAVRGRVVLFGGLNSASARLGDTWEWDSERWHLMSTPTSPSARSDAAMVYDAVHARVVLFGGFDGAPDDELWEWDGVQWYGPILPATRPPARYQHAMAFDDANARVVMFGGAGADDAVWHWDGSRWTGPLQPTPRPSARAMASMTFDRRANAVRMFGGTGSSEIWTWSGAAWTGPFTGSPQPSPALGDQSRFVYDEVRGFSLLSGGWGFDGSGWRALAGGDLAPPAPRRQHGMAYDPGTRGLLMFAGDSNDVGSMIGATNESWIFGGSWIRAYPAWPYLSPSPRVRFGMAVRITPGGGRPVLFGGTDEAGRSDEVWEWDGNTWVHPTPAIRPPVLEDPALASSGTGRVVLFGGTDGLVQAIDQTWEWDGTSWGTGPYMPATRPAARFRTAMAYDSGRDRVVLYGGVNGATSHVDTWEWNPSAKTWARPQVTSPFGARTAHTMAYNPDRRRVVLFGGTNASFSRSAEMWEWNGTSWTGPQLPPDRPSAREDHVMSYDPFRRAIILHGGTDDASYYLTDTWELDSAANARPAQVLEVVFGASNLDKRGVTRIDASWEAGGTSYPPPACTAQTGAALRAWDRHTWRNIVTNTSGPTATSLLSTQLTTRSQLRRIFVGEAAILPLAAATLNANGCNDAYAQVASDLVEVVITHRTDVAPDNRTAIPAQASCLAHRQRGHSSSGFFSIDPDGAGGQPSQRAYCDMVTAGGGWTLVGRSQPGGNAAGCAGGDGGADFGWFASRGDLDDDSRAYSLNAAAIGLTFTEILFGDYAYGYTLGDHVYRHDVPTDFLSNYGAAAIDLGPPETIAGPCSGSDAPVMFNHAGFTNNPGDFHLRDLATNGFGLTSTGFYACYTDCQGGMLHRSQGMLLVR